MSRLLLPLLAQASVSIDSSALQVEARRAMAVYAACLVERHGAAVEALLARPYDDRVSEASRDLHDVDCPLTTLTGSLTLRRNVLRDFDGLGFRGVLYQALVQRDRARLSAPAADPGEAAFVTGRMWPGSPAAAYLTWIGIGRCLLGRDPAQAGALALSPVGSTEEAAAIVALAKPLGRCGWRNGDVALVRGALSEIAYRVTFRPAVVAAEGSR